MNLNKIVYVAIPFTSPSMMEKHLRFEVANSVSAVLMERGEIVFSPISMGWPIQQASRNGITTEWSYWKETCTAYLSACRKLYVITIDGWKKSVGVQAEIRIAEDLGLEIEYIDPKDFA